MSSSPKNQLVNSYEADPRQQEMIQRIARDFKPSGDSKHFAVRLSSDSFKTAFPDGDPNAAPEPAPAPEPPALEPAPPAAVPKPPAAAPPADPPSGDDCQDEPAEAEAEEKPETEVAEDSSAPKSLQTSVKPGSVVLLADVDFLYDQWAVDMEQGRPRGQNLGFFQNLIGELTGDAALNSIRTRVSQSPSVYPAQRTRSQRGVKPKWNTASSFRSKRKASPPS